jgi:hypothetical protein
VRGLRTRHRISHLGRFAFVARRAQNGMKGEALQELLARYRNAYAHDFRRDN